MSCPHHDGSVKFDITGSPCPLHRLVDHTLTVTQARAQNVIAAMIALDVDEPEHVAFGTTIAPEVLLVLLEEYAERVRRSLAAGVFEGAPA